MRYVSRIEVRRDVPEAEGASVPPQFEEVSRDNPFPTETVGPALVLGTTYATTISRIPGVGAGAAYTAKDAFGTIFSVVVPRSGVIQSALLYDAADLGTQKDVWVFNRPFSPTADNAAFGVSDDDLFKCEGVISFPTTSFFDGANNQMGRVDAIAKSYIAPTGSLFFQVVTQAADNVAAGAGELYLALRIIPDMDLG